MPSSTTCVTKIWSDCGYKLHNEDIVANMNILQAVQSIKIKGWNQYVNLSDAEWKEIMIRESPHSLFKTLRLGSIPDCSDSPTG